MHLISLVLLAFLLGWIHSVLTPKLQGALPPTLSQGKILGTLFTGGFILVAFFLANLVLGIVGLGGRRDG